jgi:hypothetical protein
MIKFLHKNSMIYSCAIWLLSILVSQVVRKEKRTLQLRAQMIKLKNLMKVTISLKILQNPG